MFTAERAVTSARFELDDALTANRKNSSNPNALANARRRLADANDRLRQEQSAFATAQNKGGVPPPNALEAGLIAARSKDQRAFVKSAAYPGKEYDGKVVELSPSLAFPRMGSRGARRATDVEVMEVLIDLEGNVPLLPGMRVDVFFRR